MKRTAIIRRTPLKRVGLKKLTFMQSMVIQSLTTPKRRRIRQRSLKKTADDRKYAKAKAEHLKAHPRCQHPDGCTISALSGYPMDLHHKAGRNGPLLYCKRYFATACRKHHDLAKTAISESRANGWIVDVSSEEVRRLRTEEILSAP